MPTHTEAVMREAIVVTEIGEVPFAEITFIKGTTIVEDEDVTIDDEYTSGGATATEEIFAGEIEDIDYLDDINAYCESQTIEIDDITPNNLSYTKTTYMNVVIELINTLCSIVVLPDAGDCIEEYFGLLGWNADTAGTSPDGYTSVTTQGNNTCLIDAETADHQMNAKFTNDGAIQSWTSCYKTTSSGTVSGTIEVYFYYTEATEGGADDGVFMRIGGRDVSAGYNIGPAVRIDCFNNKLYHETDEDNHGSGGLIELADIEEETWYHLRIDFECGGGAYKGLGADTFDVYLIDMSETSPTQTQVGSDLAFVNALAEVDNIWNYYDADNDATANYVSLDALGWSWDSGYYIGKNFNYEQTYFKYPTSDNEFPITTFIFDGDKTIRNLLDEYATSVYAGWYFDNEKKIYCNDLDTDSGYDITTSTEIISLIGYKQMKQIDQVILLGGWTSAGIRLKVTSGAGDNIFKDTYNTITDEDTLQSIADNIVIQKQLHPVTLEVEILNATEGNFQVGETVTIGANLIFDNSETTVPPGQYIIRKSEFNIIEKTSFLILDDGLVFKKRGGLPEENSELIRQDRASITVIEGDYLTSDYSDDIDGKLAIGSANAKYINCIIAGGNLHSEYRLAFGVVNIGADDFQVQYIIPLPPVIGILKLYIESVRVGIQNADAGDYLDRVRLVQWTAYSTISVKLDDGTNRTTPEEYDYDFAAVDFSGSKTNIVFLDCFATNAGDLNIAFVEVKYYYDT